MSTGIETQRKYALAKGQALPDLSAVAQQGPLEIRDITTIYYDTPDYRLNAAKQVIRRRSGSPDAGWQAKLPTDNPDERVEVRLPPGGERLPRELRDLVAASVGESPLFPVAELRIRRAVRELRDDQGRVLALVNADEVRAAVDGRTQEWTEAEVELVEGDWELLNHIEATLRAGGVSRSPSPSKLAQALSERVARLNEAPDAPTAADVVRRYAGAQIGVLQALELAVLHDEPDAVHRTRVATRRLRSALRSFAGVHRASAVRALRDELRWHAEQLGAPRDAEVLAARLAADLAAVPGTEAEVVGEKVATRLATQHAQAHQNLVAAMVTDRYRRLQLDLELLLATPPLDRMANDAASVVLPTMLAAAVARVRAAFERAEARPTDPTRWHDLRKAAKAARYGTEAVAAVLPDQGAVQLAAWTAVTTAFGELQDSVLAQQLLADLIWQTESAPELAVLEGLRRAEDARARQALSAGRDAVIAALAE